MVQIVSEKDLMTEEKCSKNTKIFMDKLENFDKKIDELKESFLQLPYELEKRFDKRYAEKHTEKEVDNINSNLSKLLWLVVGAVVVGVLNLVIK